MAREGDVASAQLEELVAGTLVRGVVPEGPVTVIAVDWHGPDALTLTYKAGTRLDQTLLYRADEARLRIPAGPSAWTFDGDAADFRLAAECLRVLRAGRHEPMQAVSSSDVDPLPHQIRAVYSELLPRTPLRFLLADDPGAGKTIMAGLYARELQLRGALERCLVIAPGSLVEQWRSELSLRFGLDFALFAPSAQEIADGTAFRHAPLAIARMDQLSRREELLDLLEHEDFDLVVVDEAHRMSASYSGADVKATKRYALGQRVARVARNLLLMTATPHAGKEDEYQLFLALLDPDRFEGKYRPGVHTNDTTGLMRRLVKEELLTFEGKPLFPERIAETVPFDLSPLEARLYVDVTRYVREEMSRAEQIAADGDVQRSRTVGFALTVLQRRLASSPLAVLRSLQRRRDRLQARRDGLLSPVEEDAQQRIAAAMAEADRDVDEDYDADEVETVEELVVDAATAARTRAELEVEIAVLDQLVELATDVERSGNDSKWTSLRSLFAAEGLTGGLGSRKLIVFTEHRDTLSYLAERVRGLLGRDDAVVTIHGGVPREERLTVRERFTHDSSCQVLVATDAAGEGLNLQACHLMVNYDLPWNPNRLEQRFGRIHRIGQREVCRLWNLVAHETREGQVFQRLLDKAEEQRKAYGGRLFDVLGSAFADRPLRELLVEAIRYGDEPERRAELERVVDAQVADGLAELVEERSLQSGRLDEDVVAALRRQMDEARARRLQPHYVERCAQAALSRLGGRLAPRERGRFEVPNVPSAVLSAATAPGRAVSARYGRVTFDPARIAPEGQDRAELLAPGHPLLDGLLTATLDDLGAVLTRGAVLVDLLDGSTVPRLVVAVEEEVVDGTGRTVSRRFAYVTLTRDGQSVSSGAAPYLDLEPLPDAARPVAARVLAEPWLVGGVQRTVTSWAVQQSLPQHVAQVEDRLGPQVERTRAEVTKRLQQESLHWWSQVPRIAEDEAAGKKVRISSRTARRRGEELDARLEARLVRLDAEGRFAAKPPVVTAAALVLPAGLLPRVGSIPVDTTVSERRAVDAVLAAERALGRRPTEMPHNNPGYDVESLDADGRIVFIEVKGRVAGAEDFVVTANEVLTGRNADRYRLALVELSDAGESVRYLSDPFAGIDLGSFAVTSVRASWAKEWARAGPPH
ncbi:helicase-related protein [Kineococcus arenarius]|uniref:helicase-related protein n=1 Tax=Kineococcus sp. SYSU DK007 TaxID=3383128 RepID=UPI003D7D6A5A